MTSGMDLDRDNVADDVDDCLASPRDAQDDLDADGVEAMADGCPFDAATAGMDDDALPDACDPFPATGGDRLRCYMSFKSTDLNDLLWKPRDASMTWSSRSDELVGALSPAPTSYGTTIELERAPQTTYEALLTGSNGSAGIYALRMWARAKETFDNTDLGCELSGDMASTRMAIVRGNDADIASKSVFLPFPKSRPVRIAMTIAPGASGPNVRCTFTWDPGVVHAVQQRVEAVPAGRLAFGTENLQASVSALAIYDRDDAQPLP